MKSGLRFFDVWWADGQVRTVERGPVEMLNTQEVAHLYIRKRMMFKAAVRHRKTIKWWVMWGCLLWTPILSGLVRL